MTKKINNPQTPSDKQLSLNFTSTKNIAISNSSKGKVISFEKYNNYSSNNLLRDIIQNTRSF